ncbi:transcriptional adapter ADA2b-like [Carica papaya]|uniref:transcriptional adapter ADA2b-like n=1 Tax=Carica papaya TaxID=3649 RepID=UPI000B8CF1F5|nr:transcriptional adapter ADA2b-like [Carica papaya]
MGRSRRNFHSEEDPTRRCVLFDDEHDNDDPQTDRNFGGKKPSSTGNDNLIELSGYNPKRQEFDPEYDHDAEQLLAEMEFNDTDTEEERELKIRVLRAYSKRLDERQRRKDFILQRNLLYANPFEKDLSPEEIAICRSYDPFMRFHSKEEHEELLRTSVEQHRTLKRIQELKEAKAAGCRTSAEADRYLEQRMKRDSAESSRRAKKYRVGTAFREVKCIHAKHLIVDKQLQREKKWVVLGGISTPRKTRPEGVFSLMMNMIMMVSSYWLR